MTSSRLRRALLAASCAALLACSAFAEPTKPGEPYVARKLCDLADARINESSGLAASRRFSNCLWTHNDSGDAARVFLISRRGETLAAVALRSAGALDWEDIAIAGNARNSRVYIGDIGDNLKARTEITIYRFREADVSLKSTPEKRVDLSVACERQTLIYPDGAHDAETLIAARDGRLLIATKDAEITRLFVTPQPFRSGARQTLRQIGTIKLTDASLWSRLVTGGDLSADGRHLVLRTYTHAHEWILNKENDIAGDWWKRAPRSFPLPQTQQGEAICYGADGKALFLTSEKTPAPLWELSPAK